MQRRKSRISLKNTMAVCKTFLVAGATQAVRLLRKLAHESQWDVLSRVGDNRKASLWSVTTRQSSLYTRFLFGKINCSEWFVSCSVLNSIGTSSHTRTRLVFGTVNLASCFTLVLLSFLELTNFICTSDVHCFEEDSMLGFPEIDLEWEMTDKLNNNGPTHLFRFFL